MEIGQKRKFRHSSIGLGLPGARLTCLPCFTLLFVVIFLFHRLPFIELPYHDVESAFYSHSLFLKRNLTPFFLSLLFYPSPPILLIIIPPSSLPALLLAHHTLPCFFLFLSFLLFRHTNTYTLHN